MLRFFKIYEIIKILLQTIMILLQFHSKLLIITYNDFFLQIIVIYLQVIHNLIVIFITGNIKYFFK